MPSDTNILSELKDLLKLSNEWFETYKTTVDDKLSRLGFSPDIKDSSLIFEYEKLKNNEYDAEVIRDFLIKHAGDSYAHAYEQMDDDSIRNTIGEIKEISLSYAAYERDLINLKNEIKDSISEYNETTKSKSISDKLSRIERMKKSLTDDNSDLTDSQRKEVENNIKDLEYIVNMDIIFDRYTDRFRDKEIETVMESFLNDRTGSYITDKFKSKITKFGFSENIIKFFLNIEENFLDENHTVYNNLFLFIYIRAVAHADQYRQREIMAIKSLTSNITNLVYNKFDDKDREIFIDQICKVLDNYKEYYDLFKEKNTTWKDHPARKRLEKHSEDISIEYYKNKLRSLDIDESLYKDINTIDGIKNFYDEHVGSKKESELNAYNDAMVLEKSREYLVSIIKESFNNENPDMELPSDIDELLEKPISDAVVYADKILSEESKNEILDKYGKFIENARNELKDQKIKHLRKYKEDIDEKAKE